MKKIMAILLKLKTNNTLLPGIIEQTSTNVFQGITQNTDLDLRLFPNIIRPYQTGGCSSFKPQPYPCACTHVKVSHTLNCTEAVTTCNLVMCNIPTRASRKGASGKKGMVHSGREQHAAQGKENGSSEGMHATTLDTCHLENYHFIQIKKKYATRRASPSHFMGKRQTFATYSVR